MQRWAVEAAVMIAAALLLTALGPFGSWALPLGERLADWLLFAAGGYLCFRPVVAVADVLAMHTRLPRPAALAIACLVAAAPTTLLVAWAVDGMAVAEIRVSAAAARYPEVALIGLLVTTAQVAIARRQPSLVDAPAREPLPAPAIPSLPAAKPTAATFLDRLPPALGRELLALEQEDHYLRAHTAAGSALLLMRMRDAAIELAAADGARVHRSWWVARAAVAGMERRDRAIVLRLTNGLEVPVARASAAALRDAGWW